MHRYEAASKSPLLVTLPLIYLGTLLALRTLGI